MGNHTIAQMMHGLHIAATNEKKKAQEVKQFLLCSLPDVWSTIPSLVSAMCSRTS